MNEIDIDIKTAIMLTTKYFKDNAEEIRLKKKVDSIVVGDVHGDLFQFFYPLIAANVITLTGDITRIKLPSFNVYHYLPVITFNDDPNTRMCEKVIYLGDIDNEWIFSTVVIYTMKTLLLAQERAKQNVIEFIYGNHDMLTIGVYKAFKARKLDFAYDMPSTLNTLRKELSCVLDFRVCRDKVYYMKDSIKGNDFMYEYLSLMMEAMREIYIRKLGKVCYSRNGYMFSHSLITTNSLRSFIKNRHYISDRPMYELTEMRQCEFGNDVDIEDDLKFVEEEILSKVEDPDAIDTEPMFVDEEMLEKVVEHLNNILYAKPYLYLVKAQIASKRDYKGKLIGRSLVGHTYGHEAIWLNFNFEPSMTHEERVMKLEDENIKFVDFGASAGYNVNGISYPDYVLMNEESGKIKFEVTNLPAFKYVYRNKVGYRVIVMPDKHHYNKNIIEYGLRGVEDVEVVNGVSRKIVVKAEDIK